MDRITIRWLGHACFRLSAEGYSIVLDPYEDERVPGVGRVRVEADAVLCSHGHGDHNYVQAVTLRKSDAENPFSLAEFTCPHDDKNGELRGMNTVRIFTLGDVRVVHFGDIGCMPTDEQLELIGRPDAVMIPVGGHYTIDAVEACALADRVGARVVIPMHYRTADFGYAEIGLLDAFTALRDDCVFYDGDTIEIDADTAKQTAVLRFK